MDLVPDAEINLVLDMDQTLISGALHNDKPNIVYTRPYLKLFFANAFKQFERVSIWTSAERCWYDEVHMHVFQYVLPEGKTFDFVWTREMCLQKQICIRSKTGMPIDHTIYVKPLDKIYSINSSYSKYNTLIVDDNTYSYCDNIENAIPIKAFNWFDEFCDDDDELVTLSQYFKSNEFKENMCMLRESVLTDIIELQYTPSSLLTKSFNNDKNEDLYLPLTPEDDKTEYEL
jgi:hypothetical protein